MNTEEKRDKYNKLWREVAKRYPNGEPSESETTSMHWVPECEEINLWTYWQGRGNLSPKILLVGQEWGCGFDQLGKQFRNNVKRINNGESINYFDSILQSEGFTTDFNLAKLFNQALGYDDILTNKYDDLFFTNLGLGYRSKGTSGNLKKEWLTEDYSTFAELTMILEPQVILCLGKETYCGVLNALGKPISIKGSYNNYIEKDGDNPQICTSASGKAIKIYALAHPGAMGTLNRNKVGKVTNSTLDKQVADWKKIKLK